MSSPPKQYLIKFEDMLVALREACIYSHNLDLEQFSNDRKTIRAVERCFEILGEAARKIPKSLQDLYPQIPWKQITGFRNVIAHDYDETNSEILWQTVQNNLPKLEQQLLDIIKNFPQGH